MQRCRQPIRAKRLEEPSHLKRRPVLSRKNRNQNRSVHRSRGRLRSRHRSPFRRHPSSNQHHGRIRSQHSSKASRLGRRRRHRGKLTPRPRGRRRRRPALSRADAQAICGNVASGLTKPIGTANTSLIFYGLPFHPAAKADELYTCDRWATQCGQIDLVQSLGGPTPRSG